MLVAHGGTAHGYALYLKEGWLTFAVRRRGKQSLLASTVKLPAAPLKVTAVLSKNGEVVLRANETVLVTGKLPGGVVSQPVDGLDVGRDEKGAVGDYEGPFPFQGKLGQIVVELKECRADQSDQR